MNGRWLIAVLVVVGAVLAGPALVTGGGVESGETPPLTAQAWTFEEARGQLALHPEDVYLQYVVMMLGHNEGRDNEASDAIDAIDRLRDLGGESVRQVDLFSMFTGALAVQESLQLDSMMPDAREPGGGDRSSRRERVDVGDLEGPTVQSHPWGEMLAAQRIAGREGEVSPLAMCVPADQYFVLFRSLTKLLEAADAGDLWGAHLFSQAAQSAQTQQTSRRLKTQLAVETDPLSRPFYDMVVDEVAVTGSDLYLREGSDVTVVFAVKQPEVFRLRMDAFLVSAEQSREDAVRSTGKIGGVDYVEVSTPDRAIHVFSAYPREDLHVRSNSRAALERVLAAIDGKGDVPRLGETAEMKYIRTLMVRGDEREDGLVYLSDPFIRRLVGPEVKLTELRRMLCYNNLRMIGHAAMLYRTQYGKAPESLEQLAEGGCAPGVFGQGRFACPCGGAYELSADGTMGVCSHHGHAHELVPCVETPVGRVTEREAAQYKDFVEEYSEYWRRYFDPIVIRIQLRPEQYRAETIVLPLIDNTVYDGVAAVLGGEPEPLDALPVTERNIFSVALRWNKEMLLGKEELSIPRMPDWDIDDSAEAFPDALVREFLGKGIGNQIGVHVYDATPLFDFNLTGMLGEAIGSFRGGNFLNNELLPISLLVAALNGPVCISIPVEDAEIVDRFLDQLDPLLATMARQAEGNGMFGVEFDFYRVPLEDEDESVRCYAVQLGPIKWRLFFARIDDGLYIASKRFILDDLTAAAAQPGDGGPTAHAMVRIRPEHWNKVLPTYRLGWAESSRRACLDNLGPLSSVARAMSASGEGPVDPEAVRRHADQLHAVHFFCPEGGQYVVSADGGEVTCTVHGSAANPRQPAAPSAESPAGRLFEGFGGVTAELTFLEDGLHAVVTVGRK